MHAALNLKLWFSLILVLRLSFKIQFFPIDLFNERKLMFIKTHERCSLTN